MALEVVGVVVVRNEDLHVERAIRNVAAFCDRIVAFDHQSTDETPAVLSRLGSEFGQLEVTRIQRTADAHEAIERYMGTPTWAFKVDGDEFFDPAGLARLREDLDRGAYDDTFRLMGHVLNCDSLDLDARSASGWLSPPSRPVTKLFNLAAVKSWKNAPEPVHSGEIVFREGFAWDTRRWLADEYSWETDPLRMVHGCFLRRSSTDTETAFGRLNLDETRAYDRTLIGTAKRRLRRHRPTEELREIQEGGANWKRAKYARGEHVTLDVSAFF